MHFRTCMMFHVSLNVFPRATDPVGASDLSAPDDEDYEDYEEGEESETDADDPVLENLEESVLSMQIIQALQIDL